MKKYFLFSSILLFVACKHNEQSNTGSNSIQNPSQLYLIVLGNAQDGGYPQAGCKKQCCKLFWDGKEKKRNISCLGIVDKKSGKVWMFDATPDFREQHQELIRNQNDSNLSLEGIFLTHAHIGHYTGLMDLGREVMGSDSVKVYAMPKMKTFLENNGPWSQLVTLHNISLQQLSNDSAIQISDNIKVIPFLVPHRDEYSETVGYRIESKNKKILFIPDINKWNVWERNIADEIKKVDVAFIDATFYKDGEIKRKMSEVPHPFIEESIQLFENLSAAEKAKIHFIHFNHTNPVLRNTPEQQDVIKRGYRIAEEKLTVSL